MLSIARHAIPIKVGKRRKATGFLPRTRTCPLCEGQATAGLWLGSHTKTDDASSMLHCTGPSGTEHISNLPEGHSTTTASAML